MRFRTALPALLLLSIPAAATAQSQQTARATSAVAETRRPATALRIYEGATEVQKLIIARELLE